MTTTTIEPEVAIEVAKLLVQLAWADGEVDPQEQQAILSMCEEAGVDTASLQALESMLDGSERPRPPNLGLLRTHRLTAMRAVRQVLMADGAANGDELELIDEIAQLLK